MIRACHKVFFGQASVLVQDMEKKKKEKKQKLNMEKTTGTGFDYLVYFEDGIPDDYRYCLSLEGEHMIYHKFTPEDYEDFGF